MLSYDRLLEATEPCGHTVQLYGSDDALLARNAGRYFRQALDAQKSLLIVATPEHCELFARDLGNRDLARVTMLDAQEQLDTLMSGGVPDAQKFDGHIGTTVRRLAKANPQGLRAYGEMVGILWTNGERRAAAQLEALWNALLRTVNFELYCAYPIDIFSSEFEMASLDPVMSSHSHLRPMRRNSDLNSSLRRALHRVLGGRAGQLLPLMKANRPSAWGAIPGGEATILWIRHNLPDYADEIIARAREDYETSTR